MRLLSLFACCLFLSTLTTAEDPLRPTWTWDGDTGIDLVIPPAWVKVMHTPTNTFRVLGDAGSMFPAQRFLLQSGAAIWMVLLANGGRSLQTILAGTDYRARLGWDQTRDPVTRLPTAPDWELPSLAEDLALLEHRAAIIGIIDGRHTGSWQDPMAATLRMNHMHLAMMLRACGDIADPVLLGCDLLAGEASAALPLALMLRYGDLRIDRLACSVSDWDETPRLHLVIRGGFTAAQVEKIVTDLGFPVTDGALSIMGHRAVVADGLITVTPAHWKEATPMVDADLVARFDDATRGSFLHLRFDIPEQEDWDREMPRQLRMDLARQADGLHLELVIDHLTPRIKTLVTVGLPAPTTPAGNDPDGVQQEGLYNVAAIGPFLHDAWTTARVTDVGDGVAVSWLVPCESVGTLIDLATTVRPEWKTWLRIDDLDQLFILPRP